MLGFLRKLDLFFSNGMRLAFIVGLCAALLLCVNGSYNTGLFRDNEIAAAPSAESALSLKSTVNMNRLLVALREFLKRKELLEQQLLESVERTRQDHVNGNEPPQDRSASFDTADGSPHSNTFSKRFLGSLLKNTMNEKRDCHLGMGMGYLCHAYSITKFAQHQKLMADPKGPGRR